MPPRSLIVASEVTPRAAVLAPPSHPEIRQRAARGPKDDPASGDEVMVAERRGRAADIRMRGRDDDVGNARNKDVQGIDGDAAGARGLLVDGDLSTQRQRNLLIGLPTDYYRLPVNH